jgi:hypothetical protein
MPGRGPVCAAALGDASDGGGGGGAGKSAPSAAAAEGGGVGAGVPGTDEPGAGPRAGEKVMLRCTLVGGCGGYCCWDPARLRKVSPRQQERTLADTAEQASYKTLTAVFRDTMDGLSRVSLVLNIAVTPTKPEFQH